MFLPLHGLEPEEFPWIKKIKKRLYISEFLRFFIILFWRYFQVVFTVIFFIFTSIIPNFFWKIPHQILFLIFAYSRYIFIKTNLK